MSFQKILDNYQNLDTEEYFSKLKDSEIKQSLHKNSLDRYDFLNLLAPQAEKYLEKMAQIAHQKTKKWFGKTIKLYIPQYTSNYCVNQCKYCGFNINNDIKRRKLSLDEIEKEAKIISQSGMQHILILTGGSREQTPLEYIQEVIEIHKKYFSSICLEVYPMSRENYEMLIDTGADCLTIYQEVYDKEIYNKVHPAGPKSNYQFRLNAPERGAKAGFRAISIGALFGLADLEKEAFLSGLHAQYLEDNYLECDISLSLPRMNTHEGSYNQKYHLNNKKFVQFLLAYRLFLPKVGINISTRESPDFRDNLIKLGVTKMSAGSRTEVGGYLKQDKTEPQFNLNDKRSIKEVIQSIREQGYQPVFKDWEVLV